MSRKWMGFGLSLMAVASVARAGLFDAWSFNAKLEFAGYNRTETLTSFPFLVTFADGSNGFHYADMNSPSDAADLRFSSRDGGTELPYEIEKWDTNGVSCVWVCATQITGASDNAWAYWGNTGQAVPSNGSNVWRDGFKAVWHMNATNAAGLVPDSSAFGASGVASNLTNAAGRIGGAFGFNGSNSLINCGNPAEFNGMSLLTMEAWIRTTKLNALTTQRTIFRKDRVLGLDAGADAPGHKARGLFFKSGSTFWTLPAGTNYVDDGKWAHVAGVYDGSYARLYVNGKQEAAVALTGSLGSSNNNLYIGWTTAGTLSWDGVIDDVRLAQAARSSNWLWAAWMNAASNAEFLTVTPGVPVIFNSAASNVLDSTADLAANLTITGGSPVTVWLFMDTVDRGPAKTWQFATNLGVRLPGILTVSMTGLESNRNYFYTFYASNATQDAWGGPSVSFETRGPPRVDAGGATDIGYTNATLVGRLLDGFEAAVRFDWGQDPDSLTNSIYPGTVLEGPVSTLLTGLQNDASFYYRFYATNAYGEAWSPATRFSTIVLGVSWTGGGTNSLASNTNNWPNGIRPATGDAVHLDGTSVKAMTWDLSNVILRAWNQDDSYTGTVTILTRYPGQGAFTNMVVSEGVRILGGSWTHPANTGGGTAADRLMVTIGGDLIVGTNGQIDATGKGYAAAQGPGAATSADQRYYGASHGGMGGEGANILTPRPTYGSLFDPMTLGSGGSRAGGGAIQLQVAGTTRVDGAIRADALQGSWRYSGNAGGSILLKTGRLEGEGLIQAAGRGGENGTDASGPGGGGRVAVWLTASDSFGDVAIQAPSIRDSSYGYGAAGTVYLQKQGQDRGEGVLVVDSQMNPPVNHIATLMPEATAFNAAPDLSRLEAIIVTNKAVLWLNTNTVYDFTAANLRGHGASNSTVVVGGTNGLNFPSEFIVPSTYQLLINTRVSETGNWTVPSNVVLTHVSNYNAEWYRMELALDGNLTVEAGGAINVDGRGYKPGTGPAAGGGTGGYGAGYGGMGGESYTSQPARVTTYGSVTAPVNIGSGGSYAGNGAIILDISGTTTVHGLMSARRTNLVAKAAGSSGGSIWLRTRELMGAGLLDVSGTPSSYSGSAGASSGGGGGGGRLSVVLTGSDSFDQVQMKAVGGRNTSASYVRQSGAAGSLYTETASQGPGCGVVLIANDNYALAVATNAWTPLPAPSGALADELNKATLVISNQAQVALTTNVSVGDLWLLTNTVNRLFLKGYTLTVNTRYHADWGSTNDVVYDGGAIVWGGLRRGSLILIR